MRFEGRVVVVTGAAKGIGLRIARAFGREGARVAALDIDGPGADALAAELAAAGREALALKADVTVTADVRHAVETVLERWGRLDVLVTPGTVATERFRALRTEEETRRLAESVPAGRVAEPEEIADAVLFLASDAARYVTGATLDVNGGLVMV